MATAETTDRAATIALVVHGIRPEATALAADVAAWLVAQGHQVRVPTPDAAQAGLEEWAHDPDRLAVGLDLAVSVGGDGTMLRTVRLVSADEVPVLGVNLGRLGYLAQAEPGELRVALERFLAGDYGIEERLMIEVDVDAPSGGLPVGSRIGLNEAMVEKPSSGRTVSLSVSINGRSFLTYAADGLIVATPTGSTAYSFSARGPIISPTLRALSLTPVSAHMLFDRPMVLGPTETIRIEVIDDRPATLTVDGEELGVLARGDAIVCRAAPQTARLVTFGSRDFYRLLKAKFGLTDR
jgi:NAD+ kinase